jgi:hypothetical protein
MTNGLRLNKVQPPFDIRHSDLIRHSHPRLLLRAAPPPRGATKKPSPFDRARLFMRVPILASRSRGRPVDRFEVSCGTRRCAGRARELPGRPERLLRPEQRPPEQLLPSLHRGNRHRNRHCSRRGIRHCNHRGSDHGSGRGNDHGNDHGSGRGNDHGNGRGNDRRTDRRGSCCGSHRRRSCCSRHHRRCIRRRTSNHSRDRRPPCWSRPPGSGPPPRRKSRCQEPMHDSSSNPPKTTGTVPKGYWKRVGRPRCFPLPLIRTTNTNWESPPRADAAAAISPALEKHCL